MASLTETTPTPTTSTPNTTTSSPSITLPKSGTAHVKSILSGDTLLLTSPTGCISPTTSLENASVLFTLSSVVCPRLGSVKAGSADEVGAWEAKLWLRKLAIGKVVKFAVSRSSGDRYFGSIWIKSDVTGEEPICLNVAAVETGHATPKGSREDDVELESKLTMAYEFAKVNGLGIHDSTLTVRNVLQAGTDFTIEELITATKANTSSADSAMHGKVLVLIEHCFDGTRIRCTVTQKSSPFYAGNFTLTLAGVQSPRLAGLDREAEPFAKEALGFVNARLLCRELYLDLLAPDNNSLTAIGNVLHPMGNIALELLKVGYARVSDRSCRFMNPLDIPSLRASEGGAKSKNIGVWKGYVKPVLTGAKEIIGVVSEIVTGDIVIIMPDGCKYNETDKVVKMSLASIRSPRTGNEKQGKPDEPFAYECKERLRVLLIGKSVKVTVDYERDIPSGPPDANGLAQTSKRAFGTIQVGKKGDVSEVLVSEGLTNVVRHRDGEERSSRYDALTLAEFSAKELKKGLNSDKDTDGKGRGLINDLTDPKKAKAFGSSLERAGVMKATVDYIFNGSRFKLTIPKENCSIMFALTDVRVPNPLPNSAGGRVEEHAGEDSKSFAKSMLMQRNVDVTVEGQTLNGVCTGTLYIGNGGNRINFALPLVAAGLATIDNRRIDSVTSAMTNAQATAKADRIGLWSIDSAHVEATSQSYNDKNGEDGSYCDEKIITVRISEIRDGNNCYFTVIGDSSAKGVSEKMKAFTLKEGTNGQVVEVRKNKMLAGLYEESKGNFQWNRVKVISKNPDGSAKVLFSDRGNIATLPSKKLRALPAGLDAPAPAAKEATLALVKARSLEYDEGVDAAQYFTSLAWGVELKAHVHGSDLDGKLLVSFFASSSDVSINNQLVSVGLSRIISSKDAEKTSKRTQKSLLDIYAKLEGVQDKAKKGRKGIWVYGDVGEDDDENARY